MKNAKQIEVFTIELIYIIVKSIDINLFSVGKYISLNGVEYKIKDIESTELNNEKLVTLATIPKTVYCKVS